MTNAPESSSPSGRNLLAAGAEAGTVIRSYALRGGSYFFTPLTGADLLTLRGLTAVWRTPRFQRQGSFSLSDWQPLREAVHAACADGPRTRQEIKDAVCSDPALSPLSHGLDGAGADSLFKPLHWWGDICFGPPRGGAATFRWLADDPIWPGLQDPEVAGPRAICAYAHAYGPVTRDNLGYWLTEGLSVPKRTVTRWVSVCPDLVEVSVGGRDAFALESDLDEMTRSEARGDLVLVPAFDPWLMGPGTADERLLSPARRRLFSQGAQAIIRGGIVAGAWTISSGQVHLRWFAEQGPPPVEDLERQIERSGAVLDGFESVSDLSPVITVAE